MFARKRSSSERSVPSWQPITEDGASASRSPYTGQVGDAAAPDDMHSRHASTAAPKWRIASIPAMLHCETAEPSRQARFRTFRATEVLQSMAMRPDSGPIQPSALRSMFSEMSKFDFPVIAASPARPPKFDFSGRFDPFSRPTSALVTQGGLPTTRNGRGSPSSRRSQSRSKKSERTKVNLSASGRARTVFSSTAR